MELLNIPIKILPLTMQFIMGALVFMMGASLGSFLAAAVYRVTTSKKSIAFDRSECTTCGRKLTIIDLVPIFSFLFLMAKCRTCKKPISWRYFSIELTCAVLTFLIVYQDGLSLVALEKIVAILILLAVLLIDFDTWLIPIFLPIFLMAWGPVFTLAGVGNPSLAEKGIGLAAGFGFLAITLVLSTFVLRRTGRLEKDETAMGWGDPILMGGIGALIGYKLLPIMLWMACIQALVVYGVLRVRERDFAGLVKDAHAEQEFSPPARALPLGTFLCLAAIEIIILKAYL